MTAEIFKFIYGLSVWALPVLLAVTLHEAAHGFVAWRLGDDTAYRLGRVSFNPLRHIDLFGTILLPAILLIGSDGRFLFGYAKPVPVVFHRLHRPRRDMVLVALAGPITNIILAFVAALSFHIVPIFSTEVGIWAVQSINFMIFFNLLLAVFNMVPLPPLDGGRVAVGLLPDVLAFPLARLERFGFWILIGLLFVIPLITSELGFKLNIFVWVLLPTIDALRDFILILAGHG